MLTKAFKFISAVFTLIWVVIIFSEYWRYNPNYGKAIELFQYYDLLIIFIGIGAWASWYLNKRKGKPINFLRGWSVFLGLLFIDSIALNRFCAKDNGIDFSTSGLFTQIGHIIGVSVCLFLIYLLIRVLGQLFTSIFPTKISKTSAPLVEIALGILILTGLMFFLGLIGLLNGFILVPICLFVLIIYWRHSYNIIKNTIWEPIKVPTDLNAIGVFSFLFLGAFLMLNFAQIMRPFPIGSDSLRLYVNLPNLLAEYGGLVDGNQPYNWSLFMSLGLVVFGRMDVVLGLSFFGGLLSLFALFHLSRKWLNINFSALVLLLFYSPPLINFLSYMDMKIDMAMLFISLTILLLYHEWIFPVAKENLVLMTKGIGLEKAKSFFKNRVPNVLKQNSILVLIGLLAGFGFGVKLTFLFFFLTLYCTIWFFKGGKLTFLTSFFLCFAAIFLLRLDAQAELRQFHNNVNFLQWGLLIIGIGLLGYQFFTQKKKLKELVIYSLILGGCFALPVLPWIGKNFSETGQVSVTALLNGKKASPDFKLDNKKIRGKKEIIIPGVYQLPEKVKPKNKKKKAKVSNSVSEDLHRFMGYEILPSRYLSLPYDIFIKTNISNFFSDVGLLLLLIFPILFLFPKEEKYDWKSIVTKLVFMLLSILMLIISVPSAFLNKNNLTKTADGLNLLDTSQTSGLLEGISDMTNRTLLTVYGPINEWLLTNLSTKDSLTYPFLILLFLGILTLIAVRIRKHTKVTQSFIVFLFMYFFLWWILGSGAPWYGILIFSVPYIFIMKSISSKEKGKDQTKLNKLNIGSLKKYGLILMSLVWILLAFMYRSTNYNPADKERAERLYFPPIMQYQMGDLNEKKLMDYHFPNVRKLVEPINRDKKAKIYMVGSPYSFFIDKNDSRVLSDTYLDFFKVLIQRYETKEQIFAELKRRGFKYVIFDLNIFTYDVTPGKTLTRKFIQFMNSLYMNPNVELMATDRKIKLYDSGQEVFDVFQDKGSIVTSGTIGIFEIK